MEIPSSNMPSLLAIFAENKYWTKWYKKNRKHFNALVNKHKKNRRKQFQEIINEKKDVPCVVCGNKYHFAAMDFVHKDDIDKKFRISDATRLIYSIEKLIKEIEKCDVWCAVCHRIVNMEDYLSKRTSKNNRKHKLREIINGRKIKPCDMCHGVFPPYAMELDHLDGDSKVDSVSKMITNENPMENILNEVDKTRVLCLNCHRQITHERAKKASEA